MDLRILKDGLIKLNSNYSGTKLNNILKKSFMLEEFRHKYDGHIEETTSVTNIIDFTDEDFPF